MNRRTFNRLFLWGGVGALATAAGASFYRGSDTTGTDGPDTRPPEYVSRDAKGILYVDLPGYSMQEMARRNVQSREGFVIASKGNPGRSVDLITGKYAQSIAKHAKRADVSPRDIEGIMYIESGGNRNAVSPRSGAAGLTQIMPQTAKDYKMGVNFAESERLTREIADLDRQILNEPNKAKRNKLKEWRFVKEKKRMIADPRFDPYTSIAFTAQYLADEQAVFGTSDPLVPIWTYHAGRPAVMDAILKFIDPKPPVIAGRDSKGRIIYDMEATMKKYGLTYADIYFGCSPFRQNPGTHKLLRDPKIFGDSSIQYPWNVQASSDLIALSRSNPEAFRKLLEMYENPFVGRRLELIEETTKWHEPRRRPYKDVWEIDEDLDKNHLVPLPNNPRAFGFVLDKGIGELADPEVREMFRSAKPQAIGMLMTLASLTRQESGKYDQHLIVTSGVRSEAYQRLLKGSPYSRHTIGLAIDISRSYSSGAQSMAFQHALDLMQDLDLIRYVKEDDYHIHISVNPDEEVTKYFKQVYREATQLAA